MRRLLKQIPSGHIYVWTEQLAARDDMEDYTLPQAPASQPENPSENRPAASAEVPPATELDAAKAAFRKQLSKSPRKSKPATSGT